MPNADKIELGLIALATGTAAALNSLFPDQMKAGYFVLAIGSVFLIQTLIRDIVLLIKFRKVPRESMPSSECMCLESVLGFMPVILAGLLILTGLNRTIQTPLLLWLCTIPTTLLIGFRLKDYVFEWNPWRIRRDPQHINLLFKRRKNRNQ